MKFAVTNGPRGKTTEIKLSRDEFHFALADWIQANAPNLNVDQSKIQIRVDGQTLTDNHKILIIVRE